jgi:hypothetical protein
MNPNPPDWSKKSREGGRVNEAVHLHLHGMHDVDRGRRIEFRRGRPDPYVRLLGVTIVAVAITVDAKLLNHMSPAAATEPGGIVEIAIVVSFVCGSGARVMIAPYLDPSGKGEGAGRIASWGSFAKRHRGEARRDLRSHLQIAFLLLHLVKEGRGTGSTAGRGDNTIEQTPDLTTIWASHFEAGGAGVV